MATNHYPTFHVRLGRRLLLGAIAAGSVSPVLAQQPALIGARAGAVRAAGPGDYVPVVRAAAPDDFGYDEYRNGGSRNAPQPGTTMIGRAWADMKKMVVGSPKPAAAPATVPAANQGDPTLMPLSPAILPQFANGDPRRAQSNPNTPRPNPQMPPRNTTMPGNAYFGGPVMAGPAGMGPPPAMLAGKPAFNWYGYGSAPSAVTPPPGSQNWLNQTGATAGAFPHGTNRQPVPTGGMPSMLANTMGPAISIPPPSLNPPQLPAPVATAPTASPAPAMPVLPTITPAATSTNASPPPAATTPVYKTPTSQPRFDNIEEPQWQPAASPSPIQQSSGVETKGGVVPAVATEPAMTWTPITPVPPKLIPVPVESKPVPQSPATPMPQPTAVAPSTATPVRPAPQGPQMHATVRQASFQQTQPINVMSNGGFPSPVKSMIMSDPRKMLELERQIRSTCMRTATLIDVTEVTPQTLMVRYVSRTEAAARETAQVISQMTTLRPYTIQFDARLADR